MEGQGSSESVNSIQGIPVGRGEYILEGMIIVLPSPLKHYHQEESRWSYPWMRIEPNKIVDAPLCISKRKAISTVAFILVITGNGLPTLISNLKFKKAKPMF